MASHILFLHMNWIWCFAFGSFFAW